MTNKLMKAIERSEKIAIFSHINPDGDTCGSALAMYRALTLLGKSPKIFCENKLKNSLLLIDGSENYSNEIPDEKFDLTIACDCADASRLGIFQRTYFSGKIKVNIDHHKTNESFGDINFVAPQICATCELLYELLEEINKTQTCIDDIVAKSLFTGIITDSGGFTFSNVNSKTHIVASKLMKYNFNASGICEHFLKNITINKFVLKNRVLSKAMFFDDNKIGIILFRNLDFVETSTNEDDTEGIINDIRNVCGVEIAVAISEISNDNHSFKVSVRTSDNVDASRIVQNFGGGGHKNAAGCRANGFYEDIKDKLLKACRDEIC